MKKIIITIVFSCFLLCGLWGQSRSIEFRQGDWKKILQEARKLNKLVFVDCYTSWCGPCKILAKDVFTQDSVADFFNKHFVCIKSDMEKEGADIRKQYQVNSYPTLLFIDPNTEGLVHALVGCVSPEVLIQGGKNALDERNSLSGLEKRYLDGERVVEFMDQYLGALKAASQEEKCRKILGEYAETLTDEQFVSEGFWKILEAQLDYRTNPLSDVFRRFVSLHRGFYKLAEQNKVDVRLNLVVQNNMARYVRWDAAKHVPFDSVGCRALIAYLETIDYPEVPFWLAQLYSAEYLGRQDYRGMIGSMKEAMKFHFMDSSKEVYYLILFLNPFKNCQDAALVKEVIEWLGEWLVKHPGNQLLEQIKAKLEEKI